MTPVATPAVQLPNTVPGTVRRSCAPCAGLALAALLTLLGGCALKSEVRDSAHDVLTLRRGTLSGLRDLRGTGPFRRYEVAPDAMLDLIAAACGRALDVTGRPVSAIRISRRYREVVAKERGPEAHDDPSYADDWRTAVVVTVHGLEHEPAACRVEIHGTRRSPLVGGATEWERSLPGWIDDVLRERAARPAP